MTQVEIMVLPISLPCPVPVLPGTGETMRDDEAIPLEERTECCAVDAFWFMGQMPVCDLHLLTALELLRIDPEAVEKDTGRKFDHRPWEDRHRYEDSVKRDG
jgi:hypothetical protein